MIFWALTGLITAIGTALILAPLKPKDRFWIVLLTIAVPILALGLYFLIGNPDFIK